MKYKKLSSDELQSFMFGYLRAEEIAKIFCGKYGSIYTYYELKICPYESKFTFRVGRSTSGVRLYNTSDYASIPLYALGEDGEDLEATLEFWFEKFKNGIEEEKKRQESLVCDKCGRGGDFPTFISKNIKKGLEQALERAQNKTIMKEMLRFVIKERRYLHRMWMIQERESRNSEYRSNNFWVRWIEARIICKKLINIYREK